MWWFRRRDGRRSASGSGDSRAALRRALVALLEGDENAAESELLALVEADSRDVELYLALAQLFRQRGEVGRAIRVHQNLLLRSDLGAGDRVRALFGLAGDFQRGGFLQRAIAAYDEVLEQDARHRGALAGLVELLPQIREHARAIQSARRLARLEKRDDRELEARLWVEMARAAHAEGRSDESRKAVKRALKRDRRSADAQILLGELEAERGRTKAAVAAWKAVPELDRRKALDVYPRLESGFAALDRSRDYEEFLRSHLEAHPDDAGARTALARGLASRGAADQGVAELRRVLDGDPANHDARIALGRILLAEHRDTDAVKEFGELLTVLEGQRGWVQPERRR